MSENNILIQFSPTIYICNTDNKEKFKIVTEFKDIIVKSYTSGFFIFDSPEKILTLSEFNFIFLYAEYSFNIDIGLDNGEFCSLNDIRLYNLHSNKLNQCCLIKSISEIKNKIHYLTAIC